MTEQDSKKRKAASIAAIALACLVFALFFPITGFEFIDFDVPTQVENNPRIRTLTTENLKHIFTTRGSGGETSSYYPVRTLTYAIDYRIWGLDPGGFKLTNILIHLSSVLLVFWLILRLFWRSNGTDTSIGPWRDVSVATFAAGVFAVHPVVVESVTWVAGREELLMTLGAVACLHFHVTARDLQQMGGKTRRALASHTCAALCCVLACLSNAVGAAIPLLITAWDLLTLSRPKLWKTVSGTSALWVIGVTTLVAKAISAPELLGRVTISERARHLSALVEGLGYSADFAVPEVGLFTVERLMLVLNVCWLNLKTLLCPVSLTLTYPRVTVHSLFESDVLLGAMVVGLTCLAGWLLRRQTLMLFGLLWFALALGPATQIMPHHIHRADRFLYLPLVGLAVAAAAGLRPLAHFLKRRSTARAVTVAGILWLLTLVTISYRQIQTWQDSISVWKNCIRVSPDDYRAHRMLARHLAKAKQFERAFSEYDAALKISLYDEKILNEYARCLAMCDDKQQRDYDLAIRMAKWAAEVSPTKASPRTLAMVYNSFAVDLGDRGEFARAIDRYKQAIATDPEFMSPVSNLALLLSTCSDVALRRPDEAIRLAKKACRIDADANQWMILALAYHQAGRHDRAIRATQQAIRLAEAEGDVRHAESLRRRLELYRNDVTSEPAQK